MESTQLTWSTQKRKVTELIGHEKNPRKISEKQMTQLKESLNRFNLVEIPAIDTDNTILAGHQRLKAMQILGRGEETIDVRVPNRKLSTKERDEYLIRSNKNTGDWDNELLADFSKELLEDVGFGNVELDSIFGFVSDSKYTKTVAFATTDEQSILIKSALEKAKDCDGFIQYGKRYRQSDSLILIINEWLKNKN